MVLLRYFHLYLILYLNLLLDMVLELLNLSILILLMLGIIGEYLWRIYDNINGKPDSVIETVHD